MKLGIMQPYFFPYLGYFDLIYQTDYWVVFDTAQYIRHGWVNRNRILHPKSGWEYIIAPVRKHDQKTPIKDVRIIEGIQWKQRIVGQLQHYRKFAPNYDQTMCLVTECLSTDEQSLAKLNVAIMERVCSLLGISFRYAYFSEMNLQIGAVEGPGDWALRIAEALGADEYVNPPGGRSLFDPAKFEDSGIKLTIREFPNMTYEVKGYRFEPGLSIIDVLMWNEPRRILDYLAELP